MKTVWNLVILMLTTILIHPPSFARQSLDRSTSERMFGLLSSSPENDGDGLIEKAGKLTCLRNSKKFACAVDGKFFRLQAAGALFNALPAASQSNEGDNLVSRSGSIVCFKLERAKLNSFACMINK